jgi:protein-S-isoprenylcysteine O-methyltransferase Ste14
MTMTPGGANDRPPAWAVLGTLLGAPLFIAAVIVYVPYALTGWWMGPPLLGWEPLRWVGVAMIVLAVPILVDFLVRFVREGHGTPVPVAPPSRLVVGGVFRYVRNPSYLAAVAAVIGQGLILASTWVLIYAAVLALAFHLFVVTYEEPTLRRTFGEAYEAYCRDVPRWVPRVPRRTTSRPT